MADNRVRILATLDDKVSGGLARIHDKFDTLGKSKGFQSVIQGVGVGAGISAYNLLGDAVHGATDFVFDSINAASDLNETMSKSAVVFGSSAAEIDKWGDTTASAFGLSKRDATEAAATFGNLFNQIGVAKPEVASMSEAFVQLAGDLASFNNIDPTEALQKLRSGLAGEAEPLRTVGVFLSEAKVQAKALALGFKPVNGAFSESQKILARYNIILDETGSAQGDFARTSDGMANQQRILNAELKNTEAQMGAKLLPVVISAQHTFIDFFDVIDGRADAIPKFGADIGALVAGPFMAFEKAMYGIGHSVGEAIDQIGRVDTGASDMAEHFGKAADDVVAGSGKMADDVVADLGDVKGASTDWMKTWQKVTQDNIKRSLGVRDALVKDTDWIIEHAFKPLKLAAELRNEQAQLLADEEARRDAKTAADKQKATDAIISDLHDQASTLVELGDQGALTTGQVSQFEKDVKRHYGSMSKAAQADMDAIIKRLKIISSYKNSTVPLSVVLKWKSVNDTHGPGRGQLEFAEGGTVPGRKGQPQLAVVHGGEFVVSNEMQDQMRLGASLTMGGGTAPVAAPPLTIVYSPTYSTASPAEAQMFMRAIVPELTREMRRQRLI